jgi:hypothetical protein
MRRIAKMLTTEVVIYIGIALFIAAGLMLMALPYFNVILETSLSMDYVAHWDLMAIAGGIVLFHRHVGGGLFLAQQHRTLPINLMKNTASGSGSIKYSSHSVYHFITLAVCAVTVIKANALPGNGAIGVQSAHHCTSGR